MEIQPTSPERPTTKAPTTWFTGDVWFDVVVAQPAPSRLRVNLVRFAPGRAPSGTGTPGEWHWHGAGPDGFMEHLAMWETTDARDGSETEWAEPVTEEDYDA